MRFTSGRCIVWVLVSLLVVTMVWLHMTLLAQDGDGGDAPQPIGNRERSVIERTSESLSEIMSSLQGLQGPAEPPRGAAPAAGSPPSPSPSPQPPRAEERAEERVAPPPPLTVPKPVEQQQQAPPPKQAPARQMAEIKPVQISDNYRDTFDQHISKGFPKNIPLDGYMKRLSKSKQCQGKPLFVTMARVKSDLYWQLIENFFFTMYRFGHTDCAVMICISDQICMDKCSEHGFPCFDYRHDNATEPTFLQIAKLKLFYVGEALNKGVDIMLLDLDVSFLRDPLELMVGFLDNETEHIRCQMDLVFAMDKDKNGELYWFSKPGPNFGLFLVKSSEISKKVFKEAWKTYEKVPFFKKNRVASDQNVIGGSMGRAQWRMGQRFVAYFYIGTDSDRNNLSIVRRELLTPLLDKIEFYSPDHIRFELGATAAREELKDAIAVHATCYEGSTKLLALKAVNAFWDIRYYNPMERTITKPLMLVSSLADLRMELRALAFIALKTNRSLIVPNVLIGVGSGIRGKDRSRSVCRDGPNHKCDDSLPEAKDAWATDLVDSGQSRQLMHESTAHLGDHIGFDDGEEDYDSFDSFNFGFDMPEVLDEDLEEYDESFDEEIRHSNYSYSRSLLENKGQAKKKRGPRKQGGIWDPNVLYHEQTHTAKNRGERYWPAFRTIHSKRSDLKVLEPGFYFRIEDDFMKTSPEPSIVSIDVKGGALSLEDVVSTVLSHDSDSRIVLDFSDSTDNNSNSGRGRPRDIVAWAKDPLSAWGDAVIDKRGYVFMPKFKRDSLSEYRKIDILNTVYICPEFMRREYGNRACFNKCT